MTDCRIIHDATDVDDGILRDVEDVLAWFDGDHPIDWDDFLDRLADRYGDLASPPYDFEEYDSPAVRKIQRHVRALRVDA